MKEDPLNALYERMATAMKELLEAMDSENANTIKEKKAECLALGKAIAIQVEVQKIARERPGFSL